MKCVYQKNLKDCGVACLLTIIKYYGGDNTYENVRRLTKCKNNGLSALNLIEASKKLGFDCTGYKCNYDDLYKVVTPFISHVILENGYNHFIVVKKVTNEYIYVFDPGVGNRKYGKEDFSKIWDNIIIEYKVNRKLDIVKENYDSLLKAVFENKKLYIISFLISLVSIFLAILNNYYFKALLDYNNIFFVFILFMIILLIKELSDFIRNRILIKLESNVDSYLHLNTHKNLLSLPYYYFDSRSDGDIITKFEDLDYIKELFIRTPMFVVIDVFLLIVSTIILIKINLHLFLIFLFLCLIYIAILFIFDKKTKKLIISNQELKSINNSILVENIKGIESIKNLNIEKLRYKYYEDSFNSFINNRVNFEKLYNVESLFKNITLFLGINIILYIGMFYINSGYMKLSDLVLFNSIMLYFVDPLSNIYELNKIVKNGINALKRVNELYQDVPVLDTINEYDIVTNNLCFSYDGCNNIIKDLSITIDKGKKVIVTGYSGSGKSTFFKLLSKAYEVDNGMIYIGGKDINSIDVRNLIAYVSQNEILFNDTLYNNIVLNNSSDNLDEILKIVGLDEVMSKRKLSLNSVIEEDSVNLSTGEKQRVILARALLKNRKIIILDEALSGVSEKDEYRIMSNILRKFKSTTIIYSAHTRTCIDLFEKNLKIKGGINEKIN